MRPIHKSCFSCIATILAGANWQERTIKPMPTIGADDLIRLKPAEIEPEVYDFGRKRGRQEQKPFYAPFIKRRRQ